MNIIKRHVYRLEFDTWEPFDKQAQQEIDALINLLKTKHVLSHCGNIRLAEEGQS